MLPSFFSRATPNIATVIPVMDHLDQHLASSAVNLSLPASIRSAATLGKHTLNKYYNMTDLSEVYRIAMGKPFLILYLLCFTNWPVWKVLHPRHKLGYFKSAKWDDKWIKTAKQIVRDEFERTYKDSGAADSTSFNAKHDTALKKVCPLVFSRFNWQLTIWRRRTFSTAFLQSVLPK
jgi:hypothetical protein